MGVLKLDDSRIQRLLEQIRSLLERHQVESWSPYFVELEKHFQQAIMSNEDWKKQEVLEELDGLFGGMGSFNDLIIARSPHAASRQELATVNDELNRLRRQLYRALHETR